MMIRKLLDFLLDAAQTITVALSLFVMIYLFLGRPTEVLGYSMEPALDNYDRLVVENVTPRLGNFKREDIVVVHSPVADSDYVKRVIGLPGESLTIINCKVFVVNDEKPEGFFLEENYLAEDTCTGGGYQIAEGKTITIPDNHYLVMGDNRAHSFDGRSFGLLPKSAISGKAIFRFWPPSRWKLL